MSLILASPQKEVNNITAWIKKIFDQNQKSAGVIAVSGGIDSALSLTLLTQAIGPQKVYPVLLPYADQDMRDAQKICNFNHISTQNMLQINIEKAVNKLAQSLQIHTNNPQDNFRLGNIKARVRMIMVFDLAKKLNGLVCGTENKTENLLGYYTRYGDEASDLEPIAHLYKTQVRQLVQFLQLPQEIITKSPSAGLWQDQTDEDELGFSYDQADAVLAAAENGEKPVNLDPQLVDRILKRQQQNQFKNNVPYKVTWSKVRTSYIKVMKLWRVQRRIWPSWQNYVGN